jgi:hypothetical protein
MDFPWMGCRLPIAWAAGKYAIFVLVYQYIDCAYVFLKACLTNVKKPDTWKFHGDRVLKRNDARQSSCRYPAVAGFCLTLIGMAIYYL